jgi:hypothetical protein
MKLELFSQFRFALAPSGKTAIGRFQIANPEPPFSIVHSRESSHYLNEWPFGAALGGPFAPSF